jgi:DNA-directed RNA polymerase alpha subunit
VQVLIPSCFLDLRVSRDRECVRREGWENAVLLRRRADHFIFSVESAGAVSALDIVYKAIDVLRAKASSFRLLATQYQERDAML